MSPDGRLPLMAGASGTIRVENGWLGFHHDRREAPTWLVAASEVRAGRNSMVAPSEVWLESPVTGRVNLTVTHEHVHRFGDSDLEDLSERRYADEFLRLLSQSGAVVTHG